MYFVVSCDLMLKNSISKVLQLRIHTNALSPHLELNGIEWKEMKRIILEYSSLPLFRSFNGGNGKFIPLFGSFSGREWNGYERTLIPLYSLKILNFHSLEIGRNRRE